MDIRTQLFLEIRKTFKSQLKTKDIFVETAGQYLDVEEAIEDLFYENWYDVPLSALIKHRIHIASFNVVGFHFYLPAMLTAIIKHPHEIDTLTESVLFYLVPPLPDVSYHQNFIQRANLFTSEEAKIIAKFLDSYFDLFPPEQYSYDAQLVKNLNHAVQYWTTRK